MEWVFIPLHKTSRLEPLQINVGPDYPAKVGAGLSGREIIRLPDKYPVNNPAKYPPPIQRAAHLDAPLPLPNS